MEKPKFYDEAPVLNGENQTLQPGGYICVIKKAVSQKSKAGNDMLVLLLDIAEGDKKGFFQDRFDKNTKQDKKWDCVLRIVIDDESKSTDERKKIAGRLKGSIASIEDSNPGFKFAWNEESLKDKIVGAEFGLEEYTAQDGSTRTISKVRRLRSKESVLQNKVEMPQVRLLNNTYMDYNEYMEKKNNNESTEKNGEYITIESTDDLPF